MKYPGLLAAGLLTLVGAHSSATEVLRTSASNAWTMPFAKFDSERLTGGIVFDVTQALGKALGISVHYLVLPRKRIDGAVLAGDIDLRCYSNPGWTALPNEYTWSGNLFDITNVVFGGEGVAEPKDLANIKPGSPVSTVLGYSYAALDPFFTNGQLRRDDSPDQEKVMMKLDVGRTPYGAADTLTLNWYLRNTPQNRLAKWRLVTSQHDFQCGVTKTSTVAAAKIIDALQGLKRSGRIEEILRNYR